MTENVIALNHRSAALLRAVAEGRAELSCCGEPDLRIDGLVCCDQFTAHQLAGAGLVRAPMTGPYGSWTRAEITSRGRSAMRGFLAAS